jgi:hypothetical protein
VAVALRELLPVRPEQEPVVDHFREVGSERARDALLDLEVGSVVRAANDVRDPELEVVDDRGELVRRRAVGPQKRCPAHGQPDRAVVVA